jgi:hypothetical protein
MCTENEIRTVGNSATANNCFASLRLSGSFMIFFTKIIILAERTPFAIFRNEGKAAKR